MGMLGGLAGKNPMAAAGGLAGGLLKGGGKGAMNAAATSTTCPCCGGSGKTGGGSGASIPGAIAGAMGAPTASWTGGQTPNMTISPLMRNLLGGGQ